MITGNLVSSPRPQTYLNSLQHTSKMGLFKDIGKAAEFINTTVGSFRGDVKNLANAVRLVSYTTHTVCSNPECSEFVGIEDLNSGYTMCASCYDEIPKASAPPFPSPPEKPSYNPDNKNSFLEEDPEGWVILEGNTPTESTKTTRNKKCVLPEELPDGWNCVLPKKLPAGWKNWF